jgi:hypothetical protein
MTDEVTVLEDLCSPEGVRRLHVMSGTEIDLSLLMWRVPVPAQDMVQVREWEEAQLGVKHAELRWKAREGVRWQIQVDGKMVEWHGVLWYIEPGGRISEAVGDAAGRYWVEFECWPQFGWVRRLPEGVEEGVEVEIGSGVEAVHVMLADWVPAGFVAVGRGASMRFYE